MTNGHVQECTGFVSRRFSKDSRRMRSICHCRLGHSHGDGGQTTYPGKEILEAWKIQGPSASHRWNGQVFGVRSGTRRTTQDTLTGERKEAPEAGSVHVEEGCVLRTCAVWAWARGLCPSGCSALSSSSTSIAPPSAARVANRQLPLACASLRKQPGRLMPCIRDWQGHEFGSEHRDLQHSHSTRPWARPLQAPRAPTAQLKTVSGTKALGKMATVKW